MGDISADDNGGILMIHEEGHGLEVRDGIDTAELEIDPRNRYRIDQTRSHRNLL